MKRNVAKISLAAVAGASCILSGSVARAAVVITSIRFPDVTFANGTYDVVVFDVTAMTGQDATTGNNAGNVQDAEILGLSGVFTVTGGIGTPEFAAIGKAGTQQQGDFLSGAGGTYGGPGSLHSSYMAFPSDTGPVFTEVAPSSKTTGNASSITDSWYVTPGTGNGNVGGVEPGKDPQGLTIADGGSDPYATDGMLAELLVNPGATVNFRGIVSDYGYPGGEIWIGPPSSTGTGTGISPTTGTNKIISLVTSGVPTGSPPNGYGSVPAGPTLDVHTGTAAADTFPGVGLTTGFVSVTGENPSSSTELYALQLDLNGSPINPLDTRDLNKIIADIDSSDSNVSASLLISSPYAGVFPPGYDLLITTSAGSASPYFAFDFSNAYSDFTDSDTALGAVTVTGIAAVPEPAAAAAVVLGAIGPLLRRRRNS